MVEKKLKKEHSFQRHLSTSPIKMRPLEIEESRSPHEFSTRNNFDDVVEIEIVHPPPKPSWKRSCCQIFAMTVLLLGVFFGACRFSFVKPAEYHLMAIIFLFGLALISCEEIVKVHKSVVTLIMACSLWSIRAGSTQEQQLLKELGTELGNVGSVVFFLVPSMAIVEVIDLHDGFAILRLFVARCTKRDPRWMLPLLSCITFFLSAVLDNLTSTIVMVQLLRGLMPRNEYRKFSGSIVVLAANAGGAWSPVGDVTTTMLWITDRISVYSITIHLFLPSLISILIPLTIIFIRSIWYGDVGRNMFEEKKPARRITAVADGKGSYRNNDELPSVIGARTDPVGDVGGSTAAGEIELTEMPNPGEHPSNSLTTPERRVSQPFPEDVNKEGTIIFIVGMCFLMSVPVIKVLTHLPPYMPCLLALACFWLFVDLWHRDRHPLENPESMTVALRQIDIPGVMFFVGILLAVGALNASGLLHALAKNLAQACQGSVSILAFILGIISSIVDNVPLVEGVIEMYISEYPMDHLLWELTAFCAGTGGSLMIIGSVAGVTLMNMEGVTFGWYAKNITVFAFFGYVGGFFTIFLMNAIL